MTHLKNLNFVSPSQLDRKAFARAKPVIPAAECRETAKGEGEQGYGRELEAVRPSYPARCSAEGAGAASRWLPELAVEGSTASEVSLGRHPVISGGLPSLSRLDLVEGAGHVCLRLAAGPGNSFACSMQQYAP